MTPSPPSRIASSIRIVRIESGALDAPSQLDHPPLFGNQLIAISGSGAPARCGATSAAVGSTLLQSPDSVSRRR